MENKITYEDIQKANESIVTTDIKGKDYAEVNQRIKAFRMVYPQGTIKTEMLSHDNGVVVFRASIYIPEYEEEAKANGVVLVNNTRLIATGTAYEKEGSTFINKTSYIENCETSAVGRALGMAGFGIDTSIASAEEVQNAMANQEITEEYAKNYVFNFGKHKGKKLIDLIQEEDSYIDWLLKNENTSPDLLKSIEILTGQVPKEIDLDLTQALQRVIVDKGLDVDKVCEYYKVKKITDLSKEQIEDVIKKAGDKK